MCLTGNSKVQHRSWPIENFQTANWIVSMHGRIDGFVKHEQKKNYTREYVWYASKMLCNSSVPVLSYSLLCPSLSFIPTRPRVQDHDHCVLFCWTILESNNKKSRKKYQNEDQHQTNFNSLVEFDGSY